MLTQFLARCPHCKAQIKAPSDRIGKRVICPGCKQPFELQPDDTSAPRGAATDTDIAGMAATSSLAAAAPKSAAPPTEKPKDRLGRFVLRQLLGQGTFGRVYRAHDSQLDRFVALKVPTFAASDKDKIQRFLAEAKAAARLRHPNIVPIYESGQADGRYYIAAQFVAGQTLSRRLKENAPDFRQAAEWTRQLAEALAYAHGEGVIHRDIKSENIMLDDKGVPQIMDFGLAKRLNEDSAMTTDGAILGTPAYMAPEQARGETARVGPVSDQYSLGAVLYELLTGNRPYEGPPHAVIGQVLSEQEPPTPRTLRREIPRDLEAICLKAMSKHPANRYGSAFEMATDLNRWLCGEPTVARPQSTVERSLRWCRRNALTLAIASAGVSLLAIVITAIALAPKTPAPTAAVPSLPPKPPEGGSPPPPDSTTGDSSNNSKPDDTKLPPVAEDPVPPPVPLATAGKSVPSTEERKPQREAEADAKYRKQLAAIQKIVRADDFKQAKAEAAKLPDDGLGWEGRYWKAEANHAPVKTFKVLDHVPHSLRFSHDGRQILLGSSSGGDELETPWNAIYSIDDQKTPKTIPFPKGSNAGGRVCAFSHDGTSVLALYESPDHTKFIPQIWETHNPASRKQGAPLGGFPLDCGQPASDEGHWRVLAAATDTKGAEIKPPLRLLTPTNKTDIPPVTLVDEPFYAACFSRDMTLAHALVKRGDATYWETFDAASGEKRSSHPIANRLTPHPSLWHDFAGKFAWRVTHASNTVFTGAYAESDGDFVVVGDTLAPEIRVIGNVAAAFDPTGKRLFVVDGDNARLLIYDPNSPSPSTSFPPIPLVGPTPAREWEWIGLDFTPSGDLVVALDDTLTVFELRAGR